jgi:hypothetical protein
MPAWTSYEPHPSGRGYTLFGADGSTQLVGATPSVDQLIAQLPPKASAQQLADAGAGGGGGAGGAPPDVRPGPAVSVADVGPNYSPTGGGEVAVSASGAPMVPAPAPAQATPSGGGGGGRIYGRPGAGQAAGPVGPRPPSQAELDEGNLRAVEDQEIRRLQRGSPVVRTAAHWQDKERAIEGRVAPEAELEAYYQALDERDRLGAQVSEYQARRGEEAQQLEASKRGVQSEYDARAEVAGRKAQEEDLRLEEQLEAQRKALADPSAYWNSRTEGQQMQSVVAMALQGIGNAVSAAGGGGQVAKVGDFFDDAINRHLAAGRGNLASLGEAQARGQRRGAEQQRQIEVQRQAALRQVDDQIKLTVAQAQNPIVRQVIEEDVPIEEGPAAIGRALIARMREAGSTVAPDFISKANPTPTEKRLREQVQYLGAQYEAAKGRVDTARERLGIADKYAQSIKQTAGFMPERVTGGGGSLKSVRDILADRIKRGGSAAELDIKRSEAGSKAEENAQKDADRMESRTVYVDGEPWVGAARSDTEYQKVREKVAGAEGLRPQLATLEGMVAELGPSIRPERRREIEQRAVQTYEQMSTALGQGVLNTAGYKTAESFKNDILAGGPGAMRAMRDAIDKTTSATLNQAGLRPAPKRGR